MNPLLSSFLSSLLEQFSFKDLKKAALEISASYRSLDFSLSFQDIHVAAYALNRLPATYAVLRHVFSLLKNGNFKTFLDLGAGPGAGILALEEKPSRATLIEKNYSFLRLSRKLLAGNDSVFFQEDSLEKSIFPPSELVLMSYSLGEIKKESFFSVLEKAFNASEKTLVLVEPGTPVGYQTILKARSFLLEKGAFMVAPCPHEKACPLTGEDWCHFAVRLPRERVHQKLKEGTLSYEDEKYSFLIVSKEQVALPGGRIIKSPFSGKGHKTFEICGHEGSLQTEIISKKQGAFYKKARALEWGDLFDKESKDVY